MLDRSARDEWVRKVLGVSVPVREPGQPTAGDGLAAWKAARSTAIGQLKQLEAAIAAMRHPRGTSAIVLVKAIQMNLTAAPDTRRSVDELRRYLETDDIIQEAERPNGFGLKVELRGPLLRALGILERQLAS